jgi:tetratricopeptide (TPR) repeat protein
MSRHPRSPFLVAAVALLALSASAPRARADDPRAAAAELFRVGAQAFERGDFRAAALAFEEADRRSPNAITIYNAGLAWDSAGDAPRAADGFREARGRGGLADPKDAHARERLDHLERELGLIQVVAPPGAIVSVAHVVRRSAPIAAHVVPGSIEVRTEILEPALDASSPPKAVEQRKTIAVRAGESALVTFESTPRPSPVVAPKWGWIALGGALAATGAGVALGASGLARRDAFDASGRTDVAAHDDAIGFRTGANVLFGGAVALGVAGLVILLVGAPKAPRASAFTSRVAF